jgi:hypothetical protein
MNKITNMFKLIKNQKINKQNISILNLIFFSKRIFYAKQGGKGIKLKEKQNNNNNYKRRIK